MKKNTQIIILLSLAIIFWGMASIFKFIITSDIPVSFSTSEAITVHILLSLSTFLFLLTTISFRNHKPKIIMGFVFGSLFIFKLFIFNNYYIGAEYFNSSFAQLEISSLLAAGILTLFNFYLVFNRRKLTKRFH